MDRNELTLAIAAALIGALLLGWMLGWLFSRLNRPSGPRSIEQAADMATRLDLAEQVAARAEARLAEVESELGGRLTEMQRELEAAYQQIAREQARTEEVLDAYRAAMSHPNRGG